MSNNLPPHGVKLNNKPSELSPNNIAFRIQELEKDCERLAKKIDEQIRADKELSDRMTVREATMTPQEAQRALSRINSNTDTIMKLSADLTRIESQLVAHCSDNYTRFEAVADRMDGMQLKSQEYYSIIKPEKIQEVLETVHTLKLGLDTLEKRFDKFKADREKTMDEAKDEIDSLRSLIKDNQISQQKWINGIVIMIVSLTVGVIFALVGL